MSESCLGMSPLEGENERELLEAQSHVFNQVFSFISSMSLKCAVQLGIPDLIHKHGKPMSPSQLATALAIQPSKAPCVQRLMRLLVLSGFFKHENLVDAMEEEEGYVLTSTSRLLLKDNPLSVAPFLLAALDPPWQHVHLWFKNDDASPFATAHGSPMWDFFGSESRVNSFFNEAMACDTRLVSHILIDKCKGIFEGMKTLVDVAGGTRAIAMALANVFTDLTCTVLDLPHVVAGFTRYKISNILGFRSLIELFPWEQSTLTKI